MSQVPVIVPTMRPPRLQEHLAYLVRADPQPTEARLFRDTGYTDPPYGVVLSLPTGALAYLQCVGSAWPGDDYSKPDRIDYGPPPPAMTMPLLPTGSALTPLVLVERYLGALLTGAGCGEVATVDLYADRPRRGAVPHGLNVGFHNGAKGFVYVRHCVPAGRVLMPGDTPLLRRDSI